MILSIEFCKEIHILAESLASVAAMVCSVVEILSFVTSVQQEAMVGLKANCKEILDLVSDFYAWNTSECIDKSSQK